MFPHPALLIIHREIAPYLTASLERGDFKLLPALRLAAADIASKRKLKVEDVFAEMQWDDPQASKATGKANPGTRRGKRKRKSGHRWFANLNTPEEFADAEKHLDALDT